MTTTNRIEIPFSKRKLNILIATCSFCFLLGLWLVVYPPPIDLSFLLIPINKTLLGAVLMILFGFFIVNFVTKLKGNKPGLMIDAKGITDDSALTSVGQVLWTDVQEIKITSVNNQYFIMVIVKNPEEYIARVSGLKRKLLQSTYKNQGSPIMISVNGLECSLDDLFKVLQYKHRESLQMGSSNP
jgi:hypothetical protein